MPGDKKNVAQVKELIKAQKKKIQLSNDEITNLSDAQFKTLVIRMLIEYELVEYGHKIAEKVIAMEVK